MATAADLRALEDDCPWEKPAFRADLARIAGGVGEQASLFARDMQVLAALTAQVPRCAMDERGATPWTSFRREVAVARRLSDRGAAAEIRTAVALTSTLPVTLALLQQGRISVQRARVFIDELGVVPDAVATAIDAELAGRVAGLPPWRIKQETRAAILRIDPDEAARRVADATDSRGVELIAQDHDQASVLITGPAVPTVRWYQTIDQRARALKAAGDPRTLDQLRFDLAVTDYPCAVHTPPDNSHPDHTLTPAGRAAPEPDAAGVSPEQLARDQAATAAGLRPSGVEPASSDCRMSRPVQANITVPVETSLGLSNEPGWLDGYGWISAPSCRILLVDAELRRVCLQTGTGQLVDRADRDLRPPPTFAGLRHALIDLVVDDITLTGAATDREPRHDPSPPLRELVQLRDRYDDGPTGSHRPARTADLDHDTPYPHGPTAAWNLVARAQRTHQLKHHGWTPIRTPTRTLWTSPSGQIIEVPRHQQPPPGIDPHPTGEPPLLPDPDALARTDLAQLQPHADQDDRPWLTNQPQDTTTWTWFTDDYEGALPF